MQKLAQIDVNMSPTEIMQQPGFLVGIWLSLVSFVFLILGTGLDVPGIESCPVT